LDLAILPDVPHRRREHDGDRAFGFGIVDHLAHVPTERVNDLMLFRNLIVDLLGLIAETLERSAGGACADRAAIVHAELDQHNVIAPHLSDQTIPNTFRDQSAAAAT